MTDFVTHHRDHASVLLDGDLDWPKVHDLVHAIETAVEFYLYGVVEIRVRSAGGSNEPLRHILERLRVWREQGVRFRTRAVGRTSSAAALLVALGDERVADPGVPLLFHGASMYRRGDLTAAECGALHSKLLKANERMISRLVDRAIAGPLIEVEHAAEPSDRDVVEALCVGAAPDPGAAHRPGSRPLRRRSGRPLTRRCASGTGRLSRTSTSASSRLTGPSPGSSPGRSGSSTGWARRTPGLGATWTT